ncbi:acyltransferase family protein [Nocardioides sp. Iso805N]|uniref:acyltransferase family protein n=1 Tax=Nocardioides sp. Iso805N TaxID=1283287 RepID=UPI00037458B0|nr:acyltransferase family protein [Nocardioides sp. Iso805N]
MSRRDPWLDNAKMLLVALVVVGHSLTLLPWGGFHDHLYDFLYLWHMPAFVLVTGYLSRNFSYSPRRLWGLVRGLLIPYVLVEAALVAFREIVGGERHFHHLWIAPHWPLWYLPATFCWRLATPLFRRLGMLALPVAVAISLVGGFVEWDYLDVRRILGFLPFFVLGVVATPEATERLRAVPVRVAAVAVLAGVWLWAGSLGDWAQTRWLYYSWTYANLHSSLSPELTRGVLLAVGTAAALAVLALVPSRGGWFSRMGAASLVVYLCHGFVVKGVSYTGFPDWAADHVTLSLWVTVAAAIVVALLLASPWLAPRLERAIDPLTYAENRFDRARDLHVHADGLEREKVPA